MQEISHCPICGDKMRVIKQPNKYMHFLNKTANFIERTCNGTGHCLQVIIDEKTKQVDLLKIALVPDYSRFIFIDYFNQKCKIVCLKNNKEEIEIDVPKMIEPDFPLLLKLKEKVGMYICFS